jgi:hypothetical protein
MLSIEPLSTKQLENTVVVAGYVKRDYDKRFLTSGFFMNQFPSEFHFELGRKFVEIFATKCYIITGSTTPTIK